MPIRYLSPAEVDAYLNVIDAEAEMIGPLPAGAVDARRWRELSPPMREIARHVTHAVHSVRTPDGRWARHYDG